MLFPLPDPSLWDDPGEIPYSRLNRRLALWLKIPLVPAREAWRQLYQAYYEQLAAEQDEYEHWLMQAEAYEVTMAEYEEHFQYPRVGSNS